MTDLAQRERHALLDLMMQLGPDAPTRCEGWTTLDLAAHLAVRERRFDAALGIGIGGLADHSERIRLRYREKGLPALVEALRKPPRWNPISAPAVDRLANTVEFFIHHEDVRRARSTWKPRTFSRVDNEELWGRTAMARLLLRKTGLTVTLSSPAYGRRTFGRGAIDAKVAGDPGEVLLFCSGRQSVAEVEVAGPQADRLRDAKLGFLCAPFTAKRSDRSPAAAS